MDNVKRVEGVHLWHLLINKLHVESCCLVKNGLKLAGSYNPPPPPRALFVGVCLGSDCGLFVIWFGWSGWSNVHIRELICPPPPPVPSVGEGEKELKSA